MESSKGQRYSPYATPATPRGATTAAEDDNQQAVTTVLLALVRIMMKQNWVLRGSWAGPMIAAAATFAGSAVLGRPGFLIGSLIGGIISMRMAPKPIAPAMFVGALAAEEKKRLFTRILAILNKYSIPITSAIALVTAIYANREALKALLDDLKEYFQKEKMMTVSEDGPPFPSNRI